MATSIMRTLGTSSHALIEREEKDFYATDPIAIEVLIKEERFSNNIWECAVGMGHLAEVLKKNGFDVYCSDLIDRGYEGTQIIDFLETEKVFNGDIITNPPYKLAMDFIKTALDKVTVGNKVAMFLKLQFLEGKSRKKFFQENPPKVIYVSSGRIKCAKNGEFEKYPSSAIAYAWFVWEKGNKDNPIIKWIN